MILRQNFKCVHAVHFLIEGNNFKYSLLLQTFMQSCAGIIFQESGIFIGNRQANSVKYARIHSYSKESKNCVKSRFRHISHFFTNLEILIKF